MSNIKSCLYSPYKDHLLMQGDYSQLEIRVLALLSGDENLINKLNNNVDMHTEAAAYLFGVNESEVTKSQRKLAKSLSFQLQYGASAKGMANKLNISETVASKFINQYYTRFPRIKDWQENNITTVSRRAGYDLGIDYYTKKGEPAKSSVLDGHYGNVLSIGGFLLVEEDYPWGGKGFSKTAIKNYPIQGTAADIVTVALADLVDKGEIGCKWPTGTELIGTIHDSIILSVPSESTITAARFLKEVMEQAPCFVQALSTNGDKVELPVEFPVEIEVGPTLNSLEEIEVI